MCGRTAQTVHSVRTAVASLKAAYGGSHPQIDDTPLQDPEIKDNFNLSPGMDAFVIWKDDKGVVQVDRKVWGLVTRPGAKATPLAQGMSAHFSNLMFNARSDTLFDKPTFARLLNAKRSCLVVVDGFFEWKTELSKKQPYYVYSPHGLVMAGLWTSVATGRPDEETLETFTVVTTEASEQLKWLHSRQPVMIDDWSVARQWLNCQGSLRALLDRCQTPQTLKWHAVSPQMSNLKFRSEEAIRALPKLKTIESMFAKAATPKKKLASKKPDKPVVPDSKRKSVSQDFKGSGKKAKATKQSNSLRIDSFFTKK